MDAVATIDDEAGTLALFLVNRHPAESIDLTIDLRSWSEELRLGKAHVVHDSDPNAVNTRSDSIG